MGIFNYYGLIIIVLILLPNIAFAALNKDGFKNAYENKPLEICEMDRAVEKTGSASHSAAVDNALGNISVFRRHAYKRSAFRTFGSVRDNAYNAVVQKRRRRRK